MSEPTPSSPRRLLHRRAIDVQVYGRDDGLFEVEAGLTDIKSRDVPLAGSIRKAGEPVHDMLLNLLIDRQFNILEAGSQTRWMPYPGVCDQHGNIYEQLVGLNLVKGFRLGVKDRLAGIKSCTHLTELCQVLPTAVIQAFAGIVIDTSEGDAATGQPPFQLDKCHALRRDGENVQMYYPRWYRRPEPAAVAAGAVQALPAAAAAAPSSS